MTITTLLKQEIADRDHSRWLERLASVGRPYCSVELTVADRDHQLAALRRGRRGAVPRRANTTTFR